jgi:hypothetical protein
MKTVCSLLFVALASVFLAAQASGAQWVDLGTDTGGNRYWYDRATIEKARDNVMALRIKTAYSDVGRKIRIEAMTKAGLDTKGYEALSDTVALLEVNCVTEERRIVKMDHYTGDLLIPGGSWTSTLKASEGWSPILPGVIGTGLLKAVCSPGAPPGR